MGNLFELIADTAIEKLDSYYHSCHVCNKSNLDLFRYQGRHHLDNGEIDDDIYAVCAECILTKDLRHSCAFEYIKTIESYFENSSLPSEEQQSFKRSLIEKYQKTPDIPIFVQYTDRPLCCNDITEFVGHPTDKDGLRKMTENVIYWEKQVKEKSALYDFRKFLPESFKDVAAFRCRHCEKQFFTFQFM